MITKTIQVEKQDWPLSDSRGHKMNTISMSDYNLMNLKLPPRD